MAQHYVRRRCTLQCQTTAALFNRAGALFFTASAITQGKASVHFHIAEKSAFLCARTNGPALKRNGSRAHCVSASFVYKQQKYIDPTHEARCVYAKMDLDWLLLSAAQPESIKMFPLCKKTPRVFLAHGARTLLFCLQLSREMCFSARRWCSWQLCGEIYAPRASESCVIGDEANTRVHACADVLCFDSLRATWRWQKWQFVKKKGKKHFWARMQTACWWLMLWNYQDFFLLRNTPKHATVTLPNDWLCCYAAKFNLMKKISEWIFAAGAASGDKWMYTEREIIWKFMVCA